MKFRKKPVIIDAEQLTEETFQLCCEFVGEENIADGTIFDACVIGIRTLEGNMIARKQDWIIKGVKGEFYPCKPDIFEKTYDKVED